jgi:hypothetical protein
MPEEHTDAEAKLKKLGERVRDGWAKRHPIPERSLETVRQTVREEWEREQAAKRGKRIAPNVTKDRDRKPPEPER